MLGITIQRYVGVGLAVVLITGCQQDVAPFSQTVHRQHQQAAQQFSTSTLALSAAITALCQDYNSPSLQQAQQAWQEAMQDWMPFQGREKGSEHALALSWQIQFWPDKKNTTGRKLLQLLKQDVAWRPEPLAEQSVAVQGLGATEWFLFEHQQILQTPQGCQLAAAVGGYLAQNGQKLNDAWRDNPWQDMTTELALAEYLGALNNQLDHSIKKLIRPLGKPGRPKPYQAEAWRSESSLLHLKHSVLEMQQLYLAEGNGLDALLRQQGHSAIADRIGNRFDALLVDWPVDPSMIAMLSNRDGYRTLLNLYNGLEYIQIALQDDVAPALGIVVGFNATDGD